MITIILVVYHSDRKKLQDILKQLGNKYKIIIVDNSLCYTSEISTDNSDKEQIEESNENMT